MMYLRQAKLVVGDLTIEDLRFTFNVEKSLVGYPNKANIKVYNLKEANRNRIEEDGLRVELYAGYGELVLIFSGDLINVVHQKIDTDWVSELFAGDASSVLNSATINKTLAPGSTPTQMLDELVGSMQGVTKGITDGLSQCLNGKQSLLRGLQLTGNVKDWLKKLVDQ